MQLSGLVVHTVIVFVMKYLSSCHSEKRLEQILLITPGELLDLTPRFLYQKDKFHHNPYRTFGCRLGDLGVIPPLNRWLILS